MFEQLAIFTPQGQVLYQFNCLGKKFAESQINAFLNQLILSPVTKKDSVGGKFNLVNVQSGATKSFCAMFYVAKQPEFYFVITFAEQNLQLDREAEETLTLALKLWESLGIREDINENMSKKMDELHDLEESLAKFDQFLRAKYEESIKYTVSSTPAAASKEQSPGNTVGKNKNKKVQQQARSAPSNQGRKWGRDGVIEDTSNVDMKTLDFSSKKTKSTSDNSVSVQESAIDKDSFGNRTEGGDFLIKQIDDLLTTSAKEPTTTSGANKYANSAFGFLQKHFLGNKTITEQDLVSVLDKLKQQLVTKNVAPEAADYLTAQVKRDILGSKTANWTTVEDTARESLTKALTEILTPGVSVDLLHEIQKKTGKTDSEGKKSPYVFSVVGVNGVGKSTNLSKLAFWLLQNSFRVLIVACDTFRSGAVEQLRVHVENLAQLMDQSYVRGSRNKRGKTGNDYVELFEAGYGGSDLVTKIAKQAIKYGHDYDFDIILMDTAGRRHNDPTLMSPLKSFAEQAKPDKIIMVGEALVGTDSVQQAKNFNDAFGKVRNLDFFIISKCDTVGGMLGTMVNMVYATGIPILFVGVGQTYTDLRTLSVNWAVNTLMS
ncbi:Signal recognition particle receptor subunit alpha KNAG_0M01480 [Huiozyma naganishii CBS 8797]|uniref:Signal recognition particle receptor subunit alpha homolog n=1 Tax=Huiozyma naganishii (strain ATCC MYA-139 / BCRC 22969 / CBS 8797 / KCTC 17520 / NBRC 10181 / NCYC 3082 / Yp74L-3) TaxID=1071383 RepID=J7SBF4_HUIN7|nr:hypothetical protein KNAG_0M01480 [Kazachstania naganishii CBS 8797]CCK73001.1 hypothetical protein KNAG_0M01480 [Kazachstania naganishii CBS 8797]